MQPVLHVDELLHLAFQQPRDRDAGPLGHHLGDVLLFHLFLQHLHVALQLVQALVLGRQLPLRLGDASVAQLGRLLQVAHPLGLLCLGLGRVDLLLDGLDLADGLFLRLPVGLHPRRLLAQPGQFGLDGLAPLLGGGVLLLAEGVELDVELLDAPLHLIDLQGHGVDLDAQLAGGFVHQVDGLVGQEAVGDVALGEHGRRHQGRVLDPDPVVHLVALLEPPQDGDGVFHRRLSDQHGLEAPFESGVLFHVLAVFVEGGRSHYPQFAPGQHGFEHVGGIDRALGAARTHDGVHLVDEGDDLAFGIGDLLEHRLQALLELAAVLGSGHHGPDVKGHHALVLEALRYVAGHDALGQPLGDGRLAHARLADEDGVVLGPAAEHLDHATDLVVAPDHRVELAPAGQFGEVASEALQRLVLLLGVGVLGPLRAADVLEYLEHGVAGDPVALQRVAQPGLVGRQTHEHVLGGDVGVLHLVGLGLGGLERLLGLPGQADLGGAVHGGEVVQPFLQLRPHGRVSRADPLQDGDGQAAFLVEQSHRQVLGLDLGVSRSCASFCAAASASWAFRVNRSSCI